MNTQNARNTLSTPVSGDTMTFKPLFNLAPTTASAPDFDKHPYPHDFIDAKGVPRLFTRVNGHPVPVVGSEVLTSYGLGFIERSHFGHHIVRIVEFDETLEIPQYGRIVKGKTPFDSDTYVATLEPTGTIGARAMVSNLSESYNNRLQQEALWLLEKFGDTKSTNEKVDSLLNLAIDSDCFECSFVGGDYGGATEFIHKAAINPNLRAKKTKAQIRAERAALKRLADEMLEDLDAPEGIADELEECYGSDDTELSDEMVADLQAEFDEE